MNAVVRNDLREVEGLISRLLSIGETFRKNDKDRSKDKVEDKFHFPSVEISDGDAVERSDCTGV